MTRSMKKLFGVAFTAGAATIHYLYLSRVPLSGLLTLLGLPLLAIGPGRRLLLGAYDLRNWRQSLFVGLTYGLVAGSIFFTARLVMSLCTKRFRLVISDQVQRRVVWPWLGAIGVALVLNIVTVMRASKPGPIYATEIGGAMLGGLLFAVAVAYKIGTISEKMADNAFYRAAVWLGVKAELQKQRGYLRLRSPNSSEASKNPNDWDYEDGQARAIAYTLLAFGAYLVITAQAIPPLAALMLLLSLAVLLLTGVTFFWDRYRMPLFVILVAYLWLMGFCRKADHYYQLWSSPKTDSELSPAEVVGRATQQRIPLVVVAAAGGGIQSAAWTTSVLDQLDKQLKIDGEHDFPKSVRLISGVSGGSVGEMFYAKTFDESPPNFDHSFQAACTSGLGPAVRGLLRQDLLRAIAPFFVTDIWNDRGRALERAWCNHFDNAFKPSQTLRDATLSSWGRDALALTRPALVFNATIVESGERLAISTVPKRQTLVGETEFTDRYHADIAISTAARLSATFPFVSPADRPAVVDKATRSCRMASATEWQSIFPYGGSQHHVVDGGYYENSGLVGAIEWLDEALTHLTNKTTNPKNYPIPKNVLLLEVDGFERPYDTEDPNLPTPEEDSGTARGDDIAHGEIYNLESPLMTVINVRGSGQRSFARRLLRMFQRRWQLQNVNVRDVRIFFEVQDPENREESVNPTQLVKAMAGKKPAGWFYIGVDPGKEPLSWHLRPSEMKELAKSWIGFSNTSSPDSYATIHDFFKTAYENP
jgi:hypothetical protein